MGAASRYVKESREVLLGYEREELAALRFSIILTARWEASGIEGPQERAELRADLALLHRHYDDKIDDIAMTFGVEEALKAKVEVERTVMVPRNFKPLEFRDEDVPGMEELDESGFGL